MPTVKDVLEEKQLGVYLGQLAPTLAEMVQARTDLCQRPSNLDSADLGHATEEAFRWACEVCVLHKIYDHIVGL